MLDFGIPQGSLLGPIIFILYTKDTATIAEKYGLSIHIYADDTQLYIGFKPNDTSNVSVIGGTIQDCLNEIKCWMTDNFLKMNPGKQSSL